MFEAINRVSDWWMVQMTGPNAGVGDVFSYEVPGVHSCTMRVAQLVLGRRDRWRVIKSDMTFVSDPAEWVGTDLTFELIPRGAGTTVRFTHVGLAPEDECYEVCSGAWSHYIGVSLRRYLMTGTGEPSSNEAEVSA